MFTNILLLILFGFVAFSFLYAFIRLQPYFSKKAATREEAIKLGLRVEEIGKGAPIYSLTEEPILDKDIVRYSLKRERGLNSQWSILQRIDYGDTKYPEGWTKFQGVGPPEVWFIVMKNDVVSDCLKGFVKTISSTWSEEYLEFEGTAIEVHAYWHEGGGEQAVRTIYEYLKTLQYC